MVPATGVQSPAMRRSPDPARDVEMSVASVRPLAPWLRAGTDEEEGADDQAQEQQSCARPTARERGIEAPQPEPLPHQFVVAARIESPDRVQVVTLSSRRHGTRGKPLVVSKAR